MKILTFGEILLRLKPPGLERFFQSSIMEADRKPPLAAVKPMLLFHSQTLVWMCSIALSYQIMSSAMNV